MKYLIDEQTLVNLADSVRNKVSINSKLSPTKMIELINELTTTTENPFNYTIVGGIAKPSNPIENMIWINTDITIGEHQFSKTEPEARIDGSVLMIGDIWITEEKFKEISFNVFKKNGLNISIHTPKQWNGTSWENKESYIYQNGEWIEIPRILRIFPSEYACDWDNWTISTNKGTWAYSSTSMYFYGHSDGSTRKLKGFLVDFSKYSKMCIHIDENGLYNTNDFRFRWRKNSDDALAVDYRISDQSSIVGTHEIDISSITDECYLDIYFKNGGGGVVTDIWAEE